MTRLLLPLVLALALPLSGCPITDRDESFGDDRCDPVGTGFGAFTCSLWRSPFSRLR
jgi:hypothetical protein